MNMGMNFSQFLRETVHGHGVFTPPVAHGQRVLRAVIRSPMGARACETTQKGLGAESNDKRDFEQGGRWR